MALHTRVLHPQYLRLSPCACSALAQSHFLIAASARLPAEPKESPSPGLGLSRRSARAPTPHHACRLLGFLLEPSGSLTQLKAVSGPRAVSSSRKKILLPLPWVFTGLEAGPST